MFGGASDNAVVAVAAAPVDDVTEGVAALQTPETAAAAAVAAPTKKSSVFDRRQRKLDRRQKGRDEARKKMFAEGDKDGDGMLDFEEAKASVNDVFLSHQFCPHPGKQ